VMRHPALWATVVVMIFIFMAAVGANRDQIATALFIDFELHFTDTFCMALRFARSHFHLSNPPFLLYDMQ